MLFVVSTCASPGPNNVMVMSSGVNYGWRRSIPHVAGINIGFPIMVVAVGLGLDGVLRTSPLVYDVLRPVGVAYLLYLAYRIATAPVHPGDREEPSGKPLSAVQAALFQWVNPKAWIMVVGALVTYATTSGRYLPQVLAIAGAFLVLGTPCTGAWLWLGVSLKRVLPGPRRMRLFNVAMGLLLVVSVAPVAGEVFRSFSA
jgi:threonine/homoserine/homoserine lactone efflux protein